MQKPWGHERIWALTGSYVGKILTVKAGHRLSLQYHEEKEETMWVVQGHGSCVLGHRVLPLAPGACVHVHPTVWHRLQAFPAHDHDTPSSPPEDLVVIEVSTPHLDDVVRIHDDYQRPL